MRPWAGRTDTDETHACEMGVLVADMPDIVVQVLSPYVGAMAADTCVRATALSLGKTRDTLTNVDLVALEENIRRLLGPIAPAETIERVLAEIRRGAA